MRITHRIRRHERGLRFRYGELRAVLPAGTYRTFGRFWSHGRDSIEIVSTLEPVIRHERLAEFLEAPAFRAATSIVELGDTERALVWKDGRLVAILGPGAHALWNPASDEATRLRVERFDVSELRFTHAKLDSIAGHGEASKWLQGVVVSAHEEVLLFRNGQLVERLGEGKHLFWRGAGNIELKAIDLRERTIEVSGQELLTADKATVRATVLVAWQVVDSVASVTRVAPRDGGRDSDGAEPALYRAAQLALRSALGGRRLEALLGEKSAVNAEIAAEVTARAATFGVAVRSAGIRDLILPGELRELYTKVPAAEKESQANLIRRREETAAGAR